MSRTFDGTVQVSTLQRVESPGKKPGNRGQMDNVRSFRLKLLLLHIFSFIDHIK